MTYTVAARLIQIVLSVLTIKVLTSILPPEQMGRLALINTTVAFFSYSLLTPIGMFVTRRSHVWWEDGRWFSYVRWFFVYIVLVAAGAGMALVLARPFFDSLDLDIGWMFGLIFGSVVAVNFNLFLLPTLNLLGFSRPFGQLTVLSPLLALGAAASLSFALARTMESWTIGLIIGQTIPALIAWWVFHVKSPHDRAKSGDRVETDITGPKLKKMLSYGWPIGVSMTLIWIQSQGYRVALEKNVGLTSLGLFVAAYGIAMGVMSAIESVIGSQLHPKFYRHLSENPGEPPGRAWTQYAALAFPVLIFAAISLACAAREASTILLAAPYRQGYAIVAWGALIELCRTLANAYGLAFYARMETRGLILPNIFGSVVSLSLLWIGSALWGVAAAGPALAVAGCLLVVVYHFRVRHIEAAMLPWKRIREAAFAGLVLVAVTAALRVMLPDDTSLRTIVVSCIVVTAFVYFVKSSGRAAAYDGHQPLSATTSDEKRPGRFN